MVDDYLLEVYPKYMVFIVTISIEAFVLPFNAIIGVELLLCLCFSGFRGRNG